MIRFGAEGSAMGAARLRLLESARHAIRRRHFGRADISLRRNKLRVL